MNKRIFHQAPAAPRGTPVQNFTFKPTTRKQTPPKKYESPAKKKEWQPLAKDWVDSSSNATNVIKNTLQRQREVSVSVQRSALVEKEIDPKNYFALNGPDEDFEIDTQNA